MSDAPWMSPDEWDKFIRERTRAEFAISTKAYLKFIALWGFLMLLAHLNGRF